MNDTRLWKEISEKFVTKKKLLPMTEQDSIRILRYTERYYVGAVTKAQGLSLPSFPEL
jgi:hypothetical protein